MDIKRGKMRDIKFKAVMERIDGAIYVSDGYGADSSFLSYLFDFENNRWDRFIEGIITEQRFVKLFPDDDENVKGWSHIENIQWTGLLDKNDDEIYEGYIVKFIPSGEYGKVTTFGKSQNLGIEWENSKTAFFTPMFYLGCESELEIIGNIYEHSYLLDNN